MKGFPVCYKHGGAGLRALKEKREGAPLRQPRNPAGTAKRYARRERRNQKYAEIRERRALWREEMMQVGGFAQLSEADQFLIVKLLASDSREDQRMASDVIRDRGLDWP